MTEMISADKGEIIEQPFASETFDRLQEPDDPAVLNFDEETSTIVSQSLFALTILTQWRTLSCH